MLDVEIRHKKSDIQVIKHVDYMESVLFLAIICHSAYKQIIFADKQRIFRDVKFSFFKC